jgi:hypothetical protein
MAGSMTRTAYISENGNTYAIRQDASNATAVGNVVNLTAGRPPSGLRPRYLLLAHPSTGRERKIEIGDPANPLWTATESSTVNLPDFNNAMANVAYITRGRMGERRFG